MLITIHVEGDGYALGPGYLEKTIEVTPEQYEEIDYYYHKAQYLASLLEILYKKAMV